MWQAGDAATSKEEAHCRSWCNMASRQRGNLLCWRFFMACAVWSSEQVSKKRPEEKVAASSLLATIAGSLYRSMFRAARCALVYYMCASVLALAFPEALYAICHAWLNAALERVRMLCHAASHACSRLPRKQRRRSRRWRSQVTVLQNCWFSRAHQYLLVWG